MWILRFLLVLGLLAVAAVFGLRMLYPLPEASPPEFAEALGLSDETRIGARVAERAAANPGRSGVLPLFDGRDAFAARAVLARTAEQSIDARYYIWQTDETGWILLDELRAAAERGVRVRLLLDDNGIPGLDDVVAALDALPGMEVRIFNPFTLRSPKMASYLFDFPRLNRRMHNKSMTFDGGVAVVGGRNIGNIYFAYGEGTHYYDLDVLAVGPVVDEVQSDFDLYWTSASVYAASDVIADAPGGLERLAREAEAARASALGSDYVRAAAQSTLASDLVSGARVLEWTDVQMVSDDPGKGTNSAAPEAFMISRLGEILPDPESRVDLVSAYFVPGARGTRLLSSFAEAGVETRVLTNSLESNDVSPVHAAYAPYRKDLLRAGVTLLELRSQRDARAEEEETSLADRLRGFSSASLHAKTFGIDERYIFIGSFNFDPRSYALNTEMGFLVESPAMASALARAVEEAPAYRVSLTSDGALAWTERDASGAEIDYAREPRTTALQRGIATVLGWFPIEWMM